VNFMRNYRETGLIILAALFLASCSTTGSQTVYTPGSTSTAETERQEILAQQRVLAEERARQREAAQSDESQSVSAAEEARQVAIEAERLAERRVEEERLSQENARREAEETARQEAVRQRELAARRAQEQASIVAAQQARVDELRAQIATIDGEAESLDAANAVLRQAVAAAEQLTDALAEEEDKYNNTDPVTGEPLEALDSDRLDQLAEEVSSLSNQAESLLSQP
jgi:colicin import membrane protein